MDKFDLYLEKYCFKHEITPEEAMKHKQVQEVKAMYEEDSRN